jgi:phenylacetate-CoA ligase
LERSRFASRRQPSRRPSPASHRDRPRHQDPGRPAGDRQEDHADRFPLAERCLNGKLPLLGTTLDKSSGSTGKPHNWARSEEERIHVGRMIAFFARSTFGDEPAVPLPCPSGDDVR